MSWLVSSIVLSVVLTVVLNVGLRLFRGSGRSDTAPVTDREWRTAEEPRPGDRRVHVWIPWKGMLLASLILTIVVNVLLWIA